jgi:hypothetical protein
MLKDRVSDEVMKQQAEDRKLVRSEVKTLQRLRSYAITNL